MAQQHREKERAWAGQAAYLDVCEGRAGGWVNILCSAALLHLCILEAVSSSDENWTGQDSWVLFLPCFVTLAWWVRASVSPSVGWRWCCSSFTGRLRDAAEVL